MSEIMTLLSYLDPILNKTLINQITLIAEAMISMSGRMTMLGLSRWTEKGGSYRTIQRFFMTSINWPSIKWRLVRHHHLQDKESVKLLAGDTVTTGNQIRSKDIWYRALFLLIIWESGARY